MNESNQVIYNRKYYRLSYPPADRPTMSVAGIKYEVSDLSEEGIKFFVKGEDPIKQDKHIEGFLDFNGRSRHLVQGEVLRVTDTEMIIKLDEYLPLPLIMAEQRYLINTYSYT